MSQLCLIAEWYVNMAKIIGVVVYISIVTPLFILRLIPIAFCYYAAQRYYIKTSRELTRLILLVEVQFMHCFQMVLVLFGLIVKKKGFFQRNNKALDANQQAYFLNFSAQLLAWGKIGNILNEFYPIFNTADFISLTRSTKVVCC